MTDSNREILPSQPSHSPDPDPKTGLPELDLESLRLGQDFQEMVNVKKALITVPARKPGRQTFVRVRPGEEWRIQTQVLELKDDREVYLVARPLWGHVAAEVTPVCLYTAMDRQGVLFLWPVKLPGERQMEWHRSAMEAAERAMSTWVSVRANMALGAYEVLEAQGDLGDPEWPEASFEDIIGIAFKGRVIDYLDHPVLKRLRGEQ